MTTLEESPETLEKLQALQETVREWHEKQKEAILSEVLFLKKMNTLSEKASNTYIEEIANTAIETLEGIQLEPIPPEEN